MLRVFIGFAEIFLRFLVEGLFTTKRAEVIRLPFILGCACSGCGINVHTADGIMYCSCHRFYLLWLDLIITSKDNLNESHITQSLIGNSAYAYFSIPNPACSHSTMPPVRFQILVYPRDASSSAAISLIRPLRQYKTIFAFLSLGSCERFSGISSWS